MTPAVQILPPVTASSGGGLRTAGALVPAAGWRDAPTRVPLFCHVGVRDLPAASLGFITQHLAQEWMSRAATATPARVATAYAARPTATRASFTATV